MVGAGDILVAAGGALSRGITALGGVDSCPVVAVALLEMLNSSASNVTSMVSLIQRPDVGRPHSCTLDYLTNLPAAPALSHNAPWLFGVLVMPYGFSSGVSTILMPYLLRKYGVPVDQIAGVVAVSTLPSIWSFLWSPLADAGLRRRTCVLLSALVSGIAGALAILSVHSSLAWLTLLLFSMNAFAGLLGAANGALLTAMPGFLHGAAAGWYNAGNLGAGAIGGGVVIWLADNAALPVVAVAVAAAIVSPALAAFLIKEPVPARRAIGPQISGLIHDLRGVFLARRTWIGLVFFLSPVGSAAISNLISGVGPDYHAPGTEVLWVTGIAGGLLSALGSFIGGIAADRMNRMVAYALSGVLAAIFGAYLALGPATPFTYGAGYSAYAIAAGFAYAVYTALLLDVVGRRQHAAASAYATLNACGNVPIAYMTWLNGVGYKHWGARGLMGTDAVANGGFAVVLLLVATFAGHHWRQRATTTGE
jgi:PAT family beta-lactamase induction signal transducer AmpG